MSAPTHRFEHDTASPPPQIGGVELFGPGTANPTLRDRLRRAGSAGVRFVSTTERLEARHASAREELARCIKPVGTVGKILNEGGIYLGCWLESTGTINAELLSRFDPEVAQRTFLGFAAAQRDDGLFPYKLTADGPVFNQIQLVTPLARSVWTHYRLNGRDHAFLATMYRAMARYDAWLARHRDTSGTGAVEAFCTYDTGHDLSARFWHMPDSPYRNDPAAFDPANPLLPLVAPDLTANVACQRRYLATIGEELGEDGAAWRDKAAASEAALYAQCFDAADQFFYDRDAQGRPHRVQSDVLLRVLACEIGDDTQFATALERYLLNTRKFFAGCPLTSLALDDPRFDPGFDANSWSGPSNLLTLIRAPHAFEAHERHVELSLVMQPVLHALVAADRFPQTFNPFTGAAGFTECYSPAILCLMDYVERLSGILPRPDDRLWFTALLPTQLRHRDVAHETGYARDVDAHRFEWLNTDAGAVAFCDGAPLFAVPSGVRVVTDRAGQVERLIGMRVRPVSGTLQAEGREIAFTIGPNEQLVLVGDGFEQVRPPGFVPPTS